MQVEAAAQVMAAAPEIVPGQNMILQLGIAGVFVLTVLLAARVLWKRMNERDDQSSKERRDSEAAFQSALARVIADSYAANEKARAAFFEATETARAEFMAEIRRRDDLMEGQRIRSDDEAKIARREYTAAVQVMQDKLMQHASHLASLADALTRRLQS